MCADSNSTLLPHQHTTRVSGSTLGWVVDSAFVAEAGNAISHNDTCYLHALCILWQAHLDVVVLRRARYDEQSLMSSQGLATLDEPEETNKRSRYSTFV